MNNINVFILGNSNSQLCSKFDTVEINNMNQVSHLTVNNTGIFLVLLNLCLKEN